MDEKLRIEIEAAVFRRLVEHLQKHPEIQNIDLMLVADFCRNCLAKWYTAEANKRGLELDYRRAQEVIYGMPYDEWKARYQTEAPPEKLEAWKRKREAKREDQS